ncbi:calcitonin gene-related peptide 2-like isoform X1 [Peromyscus eremicus]|uniref:calcitonin gene-related peptide 2-like isoform X1 n=1 Tax=Peromyscus eremicus TaxID=42410 RepID=UPI0027DDF8F0|nr:calcitonin gene-related peptide 2-like isoform X1 [Peromyscus eremicus]
MRTPHPQDQRIRDQDSGDSRVVCALLQWKLRSRSANARVTSGPFFSFYRDTMGFWKFFTFLALSSVWILCLASNLQAAPLGSALESSLDLATLSEQEKRLLLAALVQNYYELMKARKLEQEEQETESSSYGNKQHAKDQISASETMLPMLFLASASITAQKRSCNTATCVTHRLAGLLSRSGGVVKDNFVPTNVGSKAFGRRRRDLQD